MLYLSVDFGTSSLKAAVMTAQGDAFASYKRSYPLITTQGVRTEIDPVRVKDAFWDVCAEAFCAYPDIEAICFDTFAPSVMLFDRSGTPLTPVITHLDRRSRAQTQEILAKVPEFLSITGTLPYAGGVSITTLLWLKQNHPELFRQAYCFGHLTTYIFVLLTGRWGMDGVHASMTGLFRTFGGQWDASIADSVGLPLSICPPIYETWDGPLPLRRELAAQWQARRPVYVWMGTHDVSAAQVGCGNTEPGKLLITSGSSEMLSLLCRHPTPNAAFYTRRAATKGLHQVFGITLGGFALEWFYQQFCREMSQKQFYEQYLPAVLESAADESVTFYPYLTGDRHSFELKTGRFDGLTLHTRREDMLSALVHHMQIPQMEIFNQWKTLGLPIDDRLKITGNLTQSKAYLEIKRQCFAPHILDVIDGSPLKGNVLLTQNTYRREAK